MIPEQTLLSYPVFGDNATKVEPDNNKKSNGWQQGDVVPAEWMNWGWYHNSKGITDLNKGVNSMEKELNNVLSEAGIVAVETNNAQLFKAIQKNNGIISASSTVITNAPSIETGNVVKIMFTADINGSDKTTPLTISYNNQTITVKVNKEGNYSDFHAKNVSTGVYKFIQKNTIIELVYDGTYFFIIGNPVVYTTYDNIQIFANGFISGPPIGTLEYFYRNDAPYGYLECNGGTFSEDDYPNLRAFLGSTNLPDYREYAIVGAGQNSKDGITTHDVFNVGEGKQDQLQEHSHGILNTTSGAVEQPSIGLNPSSTGSNDGTVTMGNQPYSSRYSSLFVGKIGGYYGGRAGTVTRGRRKGALICIKAL